MVAQIDASCELLSVPALVPRDSRLILHEARRRLSGDSFWLAHCIRFELDGRKLILKGTVPSFYIKQLTQSLLRDIEGVEAIVNGIEVKSATGLSSCA
jgi:hypothetical protein